MSDRFPKQRGHSQPSSNGSCVSILFGVRVRELSGSLEVPAGVLLSKSWVSLFVGAIWGGTRFLGVLKGIHKENHHVGGSS